MLDCYCVMVLDMNEPKCFTVFLITVTNANVDEWIGS